jgi:tRNA pseudouridine55 synthase
MSPSIHLVHKPVGVTSFSFVQAAIEAARAARPNRRPRICHGGTLDPFAHGLLLILHGTATRLFEHLHAVPKVYEATLRWGIETDNGDLLGRSVLTGDTSGLSPQRLDESLSSHIGWHEQVPPATSAKRIAGERAYVRVHRGETVEMPPSRVYLHEAAWLDHDLPTQSRLRIVARGGYYVRALARDLGRALGCGAHLTALHRVQIGPWADPGPGRPIELRDHDLMPWCHTRQLSDHDVGALRNDRPIDIDLLHPPQWPMPAGFPSADAPVRGFHQHRFAFVLRRHDDQFHRLVTL